MEVTDVSHIFWPFVYDAVNLSIDELLMTQGYTILSSLSQKRHRLTLTFETIWLDASDIVTLGFPENSLDKYDSIQGKYIYQDVQEIFHSVYKLYDNINLQGVFSTDDQCYKCSCSYLPRQEYLKQAMNKISMFIEINEQAEKMANFSL